MIEYGFTKELNVSFDEAVRLVIDSLKKEGFGVLTTIDIKEKFKEKLGINFQKYHILGACHPSSAHEAIHVEKNIGLLLPCNVIIFGEKNHTTISAIKPTVAMSIIKNGNLKLVVHSVERKLKKVIDSLGR